MADHFGDRFELRRTLSQLEFDRFAALSGDNNPIHTDPDFARQTKFGQTVAHGMFLFGIICGVIQVHFSEQYVYEQELVFPSPTYPGEELTIRGGDISQTGNQDFRVVRTLLVRPGAELGCESHSSLIDFSRLRQVSAGRPQKVDFPPSPVQRYKGLEIGAYDSIERAFSAQDISEFVDLTRDDNLLYLDLDYANHAGFDNVLVSPAQLGGMISYLLGMRLPGRGTNWLKQSYIFHRPVYAGEWVTARVEVSRLRPDKELVDLSVMCTVGDGVLACSGRSLVLVKDLETKTG